MTSDSADSENLIVMYHYVRPDGSAIPAGIRPLLASEFERQLDWLCERYDVVGPDEFLRRINGRGESESLDSVGSAPSLRTFRGAALPGGVFGPKTAVGHRAEARRHEKFASSSRAFLTEPRESVGDEHGNLESAIGRRSKPACLLTFDDGTKDHAQVVTPILSRRSLTGVFFVLTWPAELRKMPLTHAVHWLLGQGDEAVWEIFRRYAHDQLGGENALGDRTQAERIYHYESPTRARIKYAANMALPMNATERIVEAAVTAQGRTMADLAEEWFVSPDDIREMNAAGMTIASHGRSHRSLQTLGPGGMAAEISHSSAYIASLIGHRPTWFACPFGGSGASADALAAMRSAMAGAGIVASVSTEKRYVSRGADAYALPRWDTIDLPPGRAFER